ncbi:hypothetical protein MXB_2179 [Myxobolus squamalis]|nr:hypothetical protein MXB_2179 [Myxobolus squamalis]
MTKLVEITRCQTMPRYELTLLSRIIQKEIENLLIRLSRILLNNRAIILKFENMGEYELIYPILKNKQNYIRGRFIVNIYANNLVMKQFHKKASDDILAFNNYLYNFPFSLCYSISKHKIIDTYLYLRFNQFPTEYLCIY